MSTNLVLAPAAPPAPAPLPKYGQMLGPEAHGILVLEEFTIDPAAARKEQHGFRTALASIGLRANESKTRIVADPRALATANAVSGDR